MNGSYPLLGWKGEYNYPPTEAFPEGKLIHEIIGGPLFAEWQYNFRYSGFLVGGVGERIWTSTTSLMHPAKNYVVGSQGSDPKAKGLYEAYYQLPGGQTQEGATVICISNNSQGFD